VNAQGERFMTRHHPDGDLAPRDVVARGIARESERTGAPVYLTLQHLDGDFVRQRFPTIAAMCAQAGLDLARDRIPVGPAAHYIMGGVDTDEWARTSVPGLFAAGEVACTGVHGANRLASNSLLEGLVFGARAALAMQEIPRAAALKKDRVMADGSWQMATADGSVSSARGPSTIAISDEPLSVSSEAIRDLMWRQVGLFRTHDGLAEAVHMLGAANPEGPLQTAEEWRHWNLLTVGRLIARAALRREESRGAHYREDFPTRDDAHWKVHLTDPRDAA
jgi:L-aspartate oxidase